MYVPPPRRARNIRSLLRAFLEVAFLLSSPGLKSLLLRWGKRRLGGENNQQKLQKHISNKKVVWIIDTAYPSPSKDSGSVRLNALMGILSDLGFTVIFTPLGGGGKTAPGQETSPLLASFSDAITALRSAESLVIWMCRLPIAEFVISHKSIKEIEGAIHVYDTVDLHGLRLERLGIELGSKILAGISPRILLREIQVIRQCDKAVVVSSHEQELLRQLGENNVALISNVNKVSENSVPWGERGGQLFVGNFRHLPNVTGLKWYLQEVWPLLSPQIRGEGLTIVGSPKPRLRDYHVVDSHKIFILGHQEQIDDLVRHSKLSIAPLLSGAGVKGKVGQSLGLGVPVVATTVASEGMFLDNELARMVADAPEEMAGVIEGLMTESENNLLLGAAGIDIVRKHFSKNKATRQLKDLFFELGLGE